MKKLMMFSVIACLLISNAICQEQIEGRLLPCTIIEGDTIPYYTARPHVIIGFRKNCSKKEQKRYTKLVRNVMKVYPYARLSAEKLHEYDEMLALIPNKNDQQIAMKGVEKQLRKEFQKEIEKLTFSQGIILIKLVDRETGKTSYKIINDLRGRMRAFACQAIAKLFKYDLKTQYDPNGTDKEIEKIVRLIEDDAV